VAASRTDHKLYDAVEGRAGSRDAAAREVDRGED